jgi:hypothetical protein
MEVMMVGLNRRPYHDGCLFVFAGQVEEEQSPPTLFMIKAGVEVLSRDDGSDELADMSVNAVLVPHLSHNGLAHAYGGLLQSDLLVPLSSLLVLWRVCLTSGTDNQKEWLSGERTKQELWELLKAAHYFNLNRELIELITTLERRAHGEQQQSVGLSSGATPNLPTRIDDQTLTK